MSEATAALRPARLPRVPAGIVRGATLGASRLAGVAAQMGVQIAVGTLAGAAGIGTLQVHMAWGTLLGEVVGAGEPTRAMRDTAVNGARSVRTNLLRASRRIAAFALLPLAVVTIYFLLAAIPSKDTSFALLLSVVVAAPLFALGRLFAETLKSLGGTLAAVTFENTALPLVILLGCAGAALGFYSLDSEAILVSAVAGTLACFLLLAHSLTRHLKSTAEQQRGPVEKVATSGTEQLNFWLTGLLNIAFLQLPFLLLPWLVGAEDVGRYAVAHKLVNIITTLLILIAAVYGPRFARSVRSDIDLARRQLRETQHISLALFAPAWVAMLMLSGFWETLFSVGHGTLGTLLLILGLGQLVNAATGLSGVLLTMGGAAHLETRLLLATIAGVTATAIPLGSIYGATGVASAAASGMALRNLAGYALAQRHLLKIKEQQA